ncbi:MAG: hypothetical protein J1F36_06885 [Clostridiales bacterium]|nr:hypothetical protein [Clostridiales bacterium]
MDKKFKAMAIKKVVDGEGGIKSIKNPDLLHVVEFEAGELYEGVTDNAEVSSEADYRMITRSDDTVNSQGS